MLDTATYGIHKKLPGLDHDAAIEAVTAALKTQGFGVLTTIDVKATLKKKIDVDFRPYTILGACNPPIAHQALTAEPGMGLLLPCNVVVTVDADGVTEVGAIDPHVLLGVTGRDDLDELASDVYDRLSKALQAAG